MIINFGYLHSVASNESISEFYQALIKIPGFSHIPPDFTRWPSVKIEEVFLGKPEQLDRFKKLVTKFGQSAKESSA